MDFYPRSPCGERPYSQHVTRPSGYFYPRSPCGERPKAAAASACFATFLSTLSLRRATQTQGLKIPALCISIHALLAESDPKRFRDALKHLHFYPRSPCGERQHVYQLVLWVLRFLSTLSLRRATRLPRSATARDMYFYPRSPCGERRPAAGKRAGSHHFYPRSPCGERREF